MSLRPGIGVLLWLSLLSLVGCSGRDAPRPQIHPTVTPNGEPLAANQNACADLLAQWFERTDANHDGRLDLGELKADANRWFNDLDADHDGFVTPSELATKRQQLFPVMVPPIERARPPEGDDRPSGGGRRGGGPGRGGPGGRGGGSVMGGAAVDSDPIMAADTNLDFRVSRDEFMALTNRTFAAFDQVADGSLSPAETAASCQPQPRR